MIIRANLFLFSWQEGSCQEQQGYGDAHGEECRLGPPLTAARLGDPLIDRLVYYETGEPCCDFGGRRE